eukprot:TRINITY_DN13728_c0_g4_i2.p1 TRINITY_DN13728_c0_g4~~TRINITY_DN13728_c0_g4_i2.p1  ORF type:complete len:727 (-),score=122.23 TRINITY_DN13728_c0_g4_i2:159-2267(-)
MPESAVGADVVGPEELPPLGLRVSFSVAGEEHSGVVRFAGACDFAAGSWVGVELSEPVGKNDGAVKGVRYFECPPKHGIFIRPRSVQFLRPSGESSAPASPVGRKTLIAQDANFSPVSPTSQLEESHSEDSGEEGGRPRLSKRKSVRITRRATDVGRGTRGSINAGSDLQQRLMTVEQEMQDQREAVSRWEARSESERQTLEVECRQASAELKICTSELKLSQSETSLQKRDADMKAEHLSWHSTRLKSILTEEETLRAELRNREETQMSTSTEREQMQSSEEFLKLKDEIGALRSQEAVVFSTAEREKQFLTQQLALEMTSLREEMSRLRSEEESAVVHLERKRTTMSSETMQLTSLRLEVDCLRSEHECAVGTIEKKRQTLTSEAMQMASLRAEFEGLRSEEGLAVVASERERATKTHLAAVRAEFEALRQEAACAVATSEHELSISSKALLENSNTRLELDTLRCEEALALASSERERKAIPLESALEMAELRSLVESVRVEASIEQRTMLAELDAVRAEESYEIGALKRALCEAPSADAMAQDIEKERSASKLAQSEMKRMSIEMDAIQSDHSSAAIELAQVRNELNAVRSEEMIAVSSSEQRSSLSNSDHLVEIHSLREELQILMDEEQHAVDALEKEEAISAPRISNLEFSETHIWENGQWRPGNNNNAVGTASSLFVPSAPPSLAPASVELSITK